MKQQTIDGADLVSALIIQRNDALDREARLAAQLASADREIERLTRENEALKIRREEATNNPDASQSKTG